MVSKHYKWQTRWRVAADEGVATHDTGLRVRLAAGRAIADNAAEVECALAPKHGLHNAPAMVLRLVREGGQLLADPNAHGRKGQHG